MLIMKQWSMVVMETWGQFLEVEGSNDDDDSGNANNQNIKGHNHEHDDHAVLGLGSNN